MGKKKVMQKENMWQYWRQALGRSRQTKSW